MSEDSKLVKKLFDTGYQHIRRREYHKAIKSLTDLEKQDPTCWEGLSNLGLAYCELKKYDAAIETYNKIPANRRTSRTWFNIGITQFYRHSYQDAIEAYEKALHLDHSTQHNNVLSEINFNLGVLYFEIGNISGATRHVSESIRHKQCLSRAWALQGRINIETNNYDDATQSFEQGD